MKGLSVSVSEKLWINYNSYYDSSISEWRQMGALDKADNIISCCSDYPHKNILEIGAGDGSILKRLDKLKFCDSLYALEISESAISAIHKQNIRSLVECNLFDGYNLPYEDKQFDLVILSHVVEHLEHPRMLLYEASRISKYIFVEVPLDDTIRLKDNYIFDKVGHINFYSAKTIKLLLSTCDLDILSQKITIPSYKVHEYSLGKKAILIYPMLRGFLFTWF